MKSLLKRLSYASFLAVLLSTTNAFAADITLSKTLVDSTPSATLSDIAVAEGDTLTYEIEVCNTLPSPVAVNIKDVLPAATAIDNCTVTVASNSAFNDTNGDPYPDTATDFCDPTAGAEYGMVYTSLLAGSVAAPTCETFTYTVDVLAPDPLAAPPVPGASTVCLEDGELGTVYAECTNTATVDSYMIDTNSDEIPDTPGDVATGVSYDDPDVPGVANNTADFTVFGIDLTISKAIKAIVLDDATGDVYDTTAIEGEVVPYVIELCNVGGSDAIGIEVVDNLAADTALGCFDSTTIAITSADGQTSDLLGEGTLTQSVFQGDGKWIVDVPVGECKTFEYTITVPVGASLLCPESPTATPEVNAANFTVPTLQSVSDDGTNDRDPDGDTIAENTADFVVPGVDLYVTKAVSNVAPAVGNTLTYTLTVRNLGTYAATNVSVLDDLAPVLGGFVNTPTVTSVSPATSVDSANTVITAGTTSAFLTDGVWVIPSLAGGATATLTYTGIVDASAAALTPYTNVFTITSLDQQDDNTDNDYDYNVDTVVDNEATFMVGAVEFTIAKSASSPMIMQNTNVVYTVVVNNTSSTVATNVEVTDILPAGLTYLASSLPQVAGVYTIPSIPAMGSYSISIVAQVTAAPGTVITNVAEVAASSTQTETDTTNNDDDAIITVIPYTVNTTTGTTGGGSVSTYGGGSMNGSTTGYVSTTTGTTTSTTTSYTSTTTGTTTIEIEEPEIQLPIVRPTPTEEPKVCDYEELSYNHSLVWDNIPLTGEGVSDLLASKYDAQSVFADVSMNHPYYRSLFNLNRKSIMNGYANNADNMGADNTITRAEIAKMVLIAAEKRIKLDCLDDLFNDVNNREWYADYVNNMADMGIVSGYGDGNFGPADSVQYGQIAKIISKTFGLGGNNASDGHWATDYINTLKNKNIIPDGLISEGNYDRLLTRGEVADMLFRAITMKELGDNSYREYSTISIPKYGIDITASRTDLRSSSVWLEDLTNTGAAFSEGANGNVLFAHSSIWDFDPTPYGPVFRPLVSPTTGLQIGETFTVDGVEYVVKELIIRSLRVIILTILIDGCSQQIRNSTQ